MANNNPIQYTTLRVIVDDTNDNTCATLDFLSDWPTQEESQEAVRNVIKDWVNRSFAQHGIPTWGTAIWDVPYELWEARGLYPNPYIGVPAQHVCRLIWDEPIKSAGTGSSKSSVATENSERSYKYG